METRWPPRLKTTSLLAARTGHDELTCPAVNRRGRTIECTVSLNQLADPDIAPLRRLAQQREGLLGVQPAAVQG
jgi:hypothetical protein